MSAERRVLLSGMFDMQNYGDLLFPLVARRRLSAFGYDTQPVAPTDHHVVLKDAMPPIDIAQVMCGGGEAAGIVVGGGYIIHAHSMDFLEDYQSRGTGSWCGAGLWLGATIAAALRDIPIAWNAPGVPHPFTSRQKDLVTASVRAASYAAVRDSGSAELLALPADVPLAVVPDPIADVAALWTRDELEDSYRRLLARKGIAPRARILAIHVRNRSMSGIGAERLGAEIGAFARARGVVPMLIAVGSSHDDPKVARTLAPHIGLPLLMLDDPESLREITAALALSAAYVGASLHGYIVASAFGVPGVLLGRPAYRKFAGFLEHTGRSEDFAHDWHEALQRAAERLEETPSIRIPQQVHAALDAHWHAIAGALSDPDKSRDRRTQFLHTLIRTGLRSDGPGWALLPFLSRMTRASAGLSRNPQPLTQGARIND